MKTTPISPADLARSVIAVPPLARRPDDTLDRDANRALVRHLEAGGVRSLMYGGNANFYHLGVSNYAETVDMLAEDVFKPVLRNLHDERCPEADQGMGAQAGALLSDLALHPDDRGQQ